jgi:hypothetical protein
LDKVVEGGRRNVEEEDDERPLEGVVATSLGDAFAEDEDPVTFFAPVSDCFFA